MQFNAPFVKGVGNPTGCEWQTSDPEADLRDLVDRPRALSVSTLREKGNPPSPIVRTPNNVSPRVQAMSGDPETTGDQHHENRSASGRFAAAAPLGGNRLQLAPHPVPPRIGGLDK